MRPLVLALLAAFHLNAHAFADKWVSIDKAAGTGVFVWDNGNRYTGGHVKGKREGRGTVEYKDGLRLEGVFVNNEPLSGRMYFQDGSVYEGDFVNWKQHGKGRITHKDGGVFDGQFVDNVPIKGTFTQANGKRYEVDMTPQVQRFNGEATLLHYSGTRTTAMLVNGVEQGHGKRITASGHQMEGEFDRGTFVSGVYTFPNGTVYRGVLKNGLYEGKGSLVMSGNGGSYEGEFKDGKFQGEGTRITEDGSSYTGTWFNGALVKGTRVAKDGKRTEIDLTFQMEKRSGTGSETTSAGWHYEGDFADGLRDGMGILIATNGTRFEGRFEKGKLTEGKATYPSGAHYEGGFDANGNYSGLGTLTTKDRQVESGEYVNGVLAHGKAVTAAGVEREVDQDMYANKRTGVGSALYVWGGRYEGDFVEGKHQGIGSYVNVSGKKYEGQFDKDHFVRGRISMPNGDVYEGGVNEKGLYDGEGVMRYKDGRVYTGPFKDGKRHGIGKTSWPDGERYEGEYANDVANGRGETWLMPSGAHHEGQYRNNKFNGYGVMTWPDGDRYAGQYIDGKRQGKTENEVRQAKARESSVDLGKLFFTVATAAVIGSADGMEAGEKGRLVGGLVSDMYGGTNGEGIRSASRDIQTNRNVQGEIQRRTEDALAQRRAQEAEQARVMAAVEQKRKDASRQTAEVERQRASNTQLAALAADQAKEAERAAAAKKLEQQRAAEKAAAQAQEAERVAAAKKLEQQQAAAKERAEREAARAAEAREEANAKRDYLDTMRRSAKMYAITCPGGEGNYFLVGLLQRPKPKKVECTDVHYDAICPGQLPIRGVATVFQGYATDCFSGDAVKILPKPACPVKEVRIEVSEIRECQ